MPRPPEELLRAIPEVPVPLGSHRLRTLTVLLTAFAAAAAIGSEYNGPLAEKGHVFTGVR
jgi:hypothetical protein